MTRLLVFEDSVYRAEGGTVSTDRAFLLFASGLVEAHPQLTLLGRLDPVPGRSHYALDPRVRMVGLPHYASLAEPAALLPLLRGLRTAWRELGQADVAWLMGPHPLSIVMLGLARLRGTRTVLGVRQDLPAYARGRHPDSRARHRAADLLEAAWRALARSRPVVAVGPSLAAGYADSPAVLDLEISLVPEAALHGTPPDGARRRLLTVGRLDTEKNPLLLVDVLEQLRRDDPRWELVICGEGPLEQALRDGLAERGLSDHAELLGYVRVDDGLLDVYRSCDAFLHVSLTEGVPQVLLEAWATGLPVVATAVGGVPAAAGDAALLVPPRDAGAAADAVRRVVTDLGLRARLVDAGRARMQGRTLEASLSRLAGFLTAAARGRRVIRSTATRPSASSSPVSSSTSG